MEIPKTPPKDVWFLNVVTDDHYDNNMIVRAPTETDALEIAPTFVDYDGEPTTTYVQDPEEDKEYIQEIWDNLLEDEDEEFIDFISGKRNGWCYSSGS